MINSSRPITYFPKERGYRPNQSTTRHQWGNGVKVFIGGGLKGKFTIYKKNFSAPKAQPSFIGQQI